MKNYFGFVNDHSGSMASLATAAANDYNAISQAIVQAATSEMQDTIVSVVAVGVGPGYVERQVTISNPHVLKPVTTWKAHGSTPLYKGLLDLISLHEALPDVDKADVSFVMFTTTDGQADDSYSLKPKARMKIAELMATGRWTFVFRVPKGARHTVSDLGVPPENIQEWETTTEGMKASTVQTQAAVTQFYSSRSAGATASSSFYTTAANVNTAALNDVSKSVSLYTVGQKPEDFDGMQIKDFILARRQQYYIGAAFYQLMKLEARVTPTKLILIREKDTGKVYAGAEARKMIGLDTVNNARLHPQHGGSNIDIFIQSESVNRKLGMGHSVLYWQEKGRPMTQADIDKYASKPAVPVVPALAEAPKPGESTKSTIPVTKMLKIDLNTVQGKPVLWYPSRQAARDSHAFGVKDGNSFKAVGPAGQRWFVFA